MDKILIATKNKDKFEIIKTILSSIIFESYEYYSLDDAKYLKKEDKETGSIMERAYNKAKQVYSELNKNDYKYIIGIDDGIKMKGNIIADVKKYISDIIADNYLSEGEKVEIVRAYCFMQANGKFDTIMTEIPFKYKKINKKIELKENTYPLSNVLTPLNYDKAVSEMTKEEANNYYLNYSKEKIEGVFK